MYNWIIWFHVISFVSWFAAIFYLPRLFVYHKEHEDNAGFLEVVKIMEYKLYKYIGVPAMWATILSGGLMIYLSTGEYGVNLFKTGGWLHAKLFFVALLIAYFISLDVIRKKLQSGTCTKTGKFFRFYNEVPTILLLLIVAMVVVRPF
ncbi:protoporphyrinogen oxidase HemJ [Sulfurimonas sp. HSL-1716]|uniref:protoporphyrinogen oxidase HemJ n=1 Tax=Hydrocurvibacter sulfurireducens TaxID=3131937 RepID=UPI0031F7FDAE